jgi:hypothetical protein
VEFLCGFEVVPCEGAAGHEGVAPSDEVGCWCCLVSVRDRWTRSEELPVLGSAVAGVHWMGKAISWSSM